MARVDAESESENVFEQFARRGIEEPRSIYRMLFYVATAFFLLVALFPLYWTFALALTPETQIGGMGILPGGFNPGAFVEVFTRVPFHVYIFNSVVIAGLTTVIVLVLGSLAGYVFGRYEFPGRTPLLLGVLVISYFPPVTFLLPLFELFTGNIAVLGTSSPEVFNTPWPIVMPLSALIMPLVIFILATFYSQIPDGLEDAARIEGSTRLGALYRVIVPLSAPGVATAGIITFIIVYNEFFFSYLMVNGTADNWSPVLHGILSFQGSQQVAYNLMAAASIIGIIPMAIIVMIAQERIVSGLTQGALKE